MFGHVVWQNKETILEKKAEGKTGLGRPRKSFFDQIGSYPKLNPGLLHYITNECSSVSGAVL